jgi:hypothetical protein
MFGKGLCVLEVFFGNQGRPVWIAREDRHRGRVRAEIGFAETDVIQRVSHGSSL